MKHPHIVAVLAGLAAASVLTADASAMSHPTVGRWMSRDPGAGAGDPMGAGVTGPAVGGGFLPRDQYADGMNLYQYVNSAPTVRVDPLGLEGTDCGVRVYRIDIHMKNESG